MLSEDHYFKNVSTDVLRQDKTDFHKKHHFQDVSINSKNYQITIKKKSVVAMFSF